MSVGRPFPLEKGLIIKNLAFSANGRWLCAWAISIDQGCDRFYFGRPASNRSTSVGQVSIAGSTMLLQNFTSAERPDRPKFGDPRYSSRFVSHRVILSYTLSNHPSCRVAEKLDSKNVFSGPNKIDPNGFRKKPPHMARLEANGRTLLSL